MNRNLIALLGLGLILSACGDDGASATRTPSASQKMARQLDKRYSKFLKYSKNDRKKAVLTSLSNDFEKTLKSHRTNTGLFGKMEYTPTQETLTLLRATRLSVQIKSVANEAARNLVLAIHDSHESDRNCIPSRLYMTRKLQDWEIQFWVEALRMISEIPLTGTYLFPNPFMPGFQVNEMTPVLYTQWLTNNEQIIFAAARAGQNMKDDPIDNLQWDLDRVQSDVKITTEMNSYLLPEEHAFRRERIRVLQKILYEKYGVAPNAKIPAAR